jgi:aryl-alcohol dehydrogenase-like predicted oxidoreductase
MKYKTVPAMPSVNFSTIGFGCWALGEGSGWRDSSNRSSIAAVHKALDCGVTFFDTAPIVRVREAPPCAQRGGA